MNFPLAAWNAHAKNSLIGGELSRGARVSKITYCFFNGFFKVSYSL